MIGTAGLEFRNGNGTNRTDRSPLPVPSLIESNRIDNFIIKLKNGFSNFKEVGLKVLSNLQKKYEAILLADAKYSDEIIAWSKSSPVKSNPLRGFSAIIPEGPKGFPVLLANRKLLTRGCNIWFRRKTQSTKHTTDQNILSSFKLNNNN